MVSQVVRISEENVQSVPETVSAEGAHYISGFAKHDGQLVILLDVDELLNLQKPERQLRSDTTGTPPAT
jgi:chemotaxis signal transduction protein